MKTHKTNYPEPWKIVLFFSVIILIVSLKGFSTDNDAIGVLHQRFDVTESLPRMSPYFMSIVEYELIPGHANCDCVVNVLDVITITDYYIGNEPHPLCFENADVNGDGAINVMDVISTIEIFLSDSNDHGTVTDIDGNVYQTVIIVQSYV